MRLFELIEYDTIELVRALLAVAGIACTVLLYVGYTYGLDVVRRRTRWTLYILAPLSLLTYANLGQLHWGDYLNTYDVYHYYMGAKYFDELGHLYLYEATIAASYEDNLRPKGVRVYRDQATYDIVDLSKLYETNPKWQKNFPSERWEEFKADLAFFAPRMSLDGWRHALQDKGYNPSPVWTMLGQALANWIPARKGFGMVFLCHLDVLFILAALIGIGWAFGVDVALIAAVFFGVNISTPYSAVGGAFLRYDYLMWAVLSICTLKRGYPGVGGAMLSYAALLRLSPLLYTAGIASVGLYRLVKHRVIDRTCLRFTAGFFIGAIALILMSVIALPQGIEAWSQFADKMETHRESLGTKRYGLTYFFLWNGEVTRDDLHLDDGGWPAYDERKKDRLDDLSWACHGMQALIVIGFVAATMRLEPWEALCLGVLLIFAFLSPTRYYYAQLLTLVPLLLYQWKSPPRITSMCLLFGVMLVVLVFQTLSGELAFIQYVMSAALLLYFAHTVTILMLEERSAATQSE